jgi:translation initiation factor RLI1
MIRWLTLWTKALKFCIEHYSKYSDYIEPERIIFVPGETDIKIPAKRIKSGKVKIFLKSLVMSARMANSQMKPFVSEEDSEDDN